MTGNTFFIDGKPFAYWDGERWALILPEEEEPKPRHQNKTREKRKRILLGVGRRGKR